MTSEFTGYSFSEIIDRIEKTGRKHLSLCAKRENGLWRVFVEWL